MPGKFCRAGGLGVADAQGEDALDLAAFQQQIADFQARRVVGHRLEGLRALPGIEGGRAVRRQSGTPI